MAKRRDVLRLGAGIAVVAGAGSVAGTLAQFGGAEGTRRLFSAGQLSGSQEVPPNSTDGTGAALFRQSEDGSTLHYVLFVARVNDVVQAHVHVGARGENGPVVAFLFGQEDESGAFTSALTQGVSENGVLAEGSITADDLVGPLAGATLSDLAEELEAENAYVNVHSESLPGGEVRGQIRRVEQVSVELSETERVEATEDGVATERTVTLFVSEDRDGDDDDDNGDDNGDGNDDNGDDNGDGNGNGNGDDGDGTPDTPDGDTPDNG